jgi:hypothetical protein
MTPKDREAPTQEYILRAMATNYAGGHCWDHLDGEVCVKAADEIKRLRAPPAAEGMPVAWLYEMAFYIKPSDGNPHRDWNQVVTTTPPPAIPKDGVRNVEPLYRAPPSGSAVAMREALEWIEKDDRYWTNNQTADEVLERAPSGNVKIRGPYARRAYAALAAPQPQDGERAAMDAIRNYLATFDRCGGSESVSADEFAECRAAMRAVVTRPHRGMGE